MSKQPILPYLGFGLGLRPEHYETIINKKPNIDWFEIITENFLVDGGKPLYYLDQIKECYPLVMHGVSLSIGSTDPLDIAYLSQIKSLINRIKPKWVSDHLCWTGVDGVNTHDLLPLPYTQEVIEHVVSRIKQVQDYLGQRILIENVSSYVTFKQSKMTEWDFISQIIEQADCLMLLDINNVYISAVNHHFDPYQYLDSIPIHRVQQFHLAGHSRQGNYLIDTHDTDIAPPVWDLYAYACKRFGKIATMIERDDNIPTLSALMTELDKARQITNEINLAVTI